MSFQQTILSKIKDIVNKLNEIASRARRIDELPEQAATTPTGDIHVSNNGISEKVSLNKIIQTGQTPSLQQVVDASGNAVNVNTYKPLSYTTQDDIELISETNISLNADEGVIINNLSGEGQRPIGVDADGKVIEFSSASNSISRIVSLGENALYKFATPITIRVDFPDVKVNDTVIVNQVDRYNSAIFYKAACTSNNHVTVTACCMEEKHNYQETQKIKITVLQDQVGFSSESGNPNPEIEERLRKLEQKAAIFELNGGVIPWSGNIENLPKGWVLCDGSNNTPDLRGRFIVGQDPRNEDYNTIGKTGGLEKVSLSVDEMPKHKHNGSTGSSGSHSHNYTMIGWINGGDSFSSGKNANYKLEQTHPAGAHTHTFNTNEVGGSQAHENRPPYYVLAYIMFIG